MNIRSSKLNLPPKPIGGGVLSNKSHPKVFSDYRFLQKKELRPNVS
jgi:hypothetical protein